MSVTIDPEILEKAGDFNLDEISVKTITNDKVDFKAAFIELNIFESIYSNAVNGNIVIRDSGQLYKSVCYIRTRNNCFQRTYARMQRAMTKSTSKSFPHVYTKFLTKYQQKNENKFIRYTLHRQRQSKT